MKKRFKDLSPRKKAVFLGVYLLFVFLFLEGICRFYIVVKQGGAWFNPYRMMLGTYPELADAVEETAKQGGRFRVLLLGGSVLDPAYGSVGRRLAQKLKEKGVPGVEIVNVAREALTTRDSWLKYGFLARSRFDVVFLYHGINEVRANNCPAEVFRADYSHYSWYELQNAACRHRDLMRLTVIPYWFDYLYHMVRQTASPEMYVPRDAPREDWLVHGATVKTASSFRRNTERIVDLAREKGETLILSTFAYYLPENYSRAAFTNGVLGYADGGLAVELWGKPEHVVKGIKEHNRMVREVAAELDRSRAQGKDLPVYFVDMEQGIPKEGQYFVDVCHLSPAGCDLFAARLVNVIEATGAAREVP